MPGSRLGGLGGGSVHGCTYSIANVSAWAEVSGRAGWRAGGRAERGRAVTRARAHDAVAGQGARSWASSGGAGAGLCSA